MAPLRSDSARRTRSEYTCASCGYGIVVSRLPKACPMCRATAWRPGKSGLATKGRRSLWPPRASLGTLALVLLLAATVVAGVASGSSERSVFATQVPANTSPPTIVGTAQQGSGLAASTGAWSNSPTSFAYQWQRCDNTGANCGDIASATGSTYALTATDAGSTVRVLVTATNGSGSSASAASSATGVVAASAAGAPMNTAAPTISGTAGQGQTLTASSGTWTGSGISFAYQWLRCDSTGGACSNIGGATAQTYTVAAGDVGSTLRVTVTATNGSGSNSAPSASTGIVTGGSAPANTSPPTISGTAAQGQTLTASTGTWTGTTPITYTYQWQRCDAGGGNCAAIAGATSQTYVATSADVGKTLRVLVTGTNGVGSSSVLSASTSAVAAPSGPANTSPPTISGTARQGDLLTAGVGAWSGTPPITYTYQWQRCDSNGASCAVISGATTQTYRPTVSDVNRRLRVSVTATNSAGKASALSAATGLIAPSVPQNTALPTIAGTLQEGQTLAVSAGTWASATPITLYYQWARCTATGQSCIPIPGAQRPTYTLTSEDVGHALFVQIKAQNSVGASFANSKPTGVVAQRTKPPTPPPPAPTAAGSVAVSAVSLPNRLVIDKVQFVPSRITSRSQPLVARVHVTETVGGKPVSGAFVYALGVPFNRLSTAPEVGTGADGWATVTFQLLPGFALRRGNLVVVFIRARKSGETALAGVSTRRLVSVRVG